MSTKTFCDVCGSGLDGDENAAKVAVEIEGTLRASDRGMGAGMPRKITVEIRVNKTDRDWDLCRDCVYEVLDFGDQRVKDTTA